MPKISVVMSVYNTKEEWLRESIESILNQTYTDFEFIIINDGSMNNAQDVILSYNDARIKYIKQENQGLAKSLNNGLNLAQGEYIARMDSDDISLPERFKKQVEFMDKNPDVSVLGTWFEMFPKKQIIHHMPRPKYLDLLKGCILGHPTVMLRKADFDKYNLRYNPEYKCEDYELWSRAIRYLKFDNLQEVFLKYRWHENNLSKPNEVFSASVRKVQQNMLDFLTDDKELQQIILIDLYHPKMKYNFWERIFSVKNHVENGIKRKIVCVLGVKIKFKKYSKIRIVRLMGGLGNQMFQWAFLKALEHKTNKKVLPDKSWFEEAQKAIVNENRENSAGVVMRKYDLDIFDLHPNFATEEQVKNIKKRIFEKKEFEFDHDMLKDEKSAIYEGYFQNEGYFKEIKEEIKKDFTFPEISKDDEFNQQWLTKIKACQNPVFIHFRRGDYVNLGWDLSIDYYKKAIEYIKTRVQDPAFFIFGQDCEEYIRKEFKDSDIKFEIIGEENSKNNQDWKDMVLMKECKHAIIANSSFSWWAAWLGRANEDGIVVAPTPFINGKDSIICDNWIKIER